VQLSLNLLLRTDSINQLDDVVTEIIQKCRNIVTALHFKTNLTEDETGDKNIVTALQANMANTINIIDLEDQFSSTLLENDDKEDST